MLPELLACLFACDVQKREKSHQTHGFLFFFLNFYMCEAGREGNQREYQSSEECRNASEIVNIFVRTVGAGESGGSGEGGRRPSPSGAAR